MLTVGILCIYFMVALPRLSATIAKLVSPDRRAHVNLLLQRSFDKIGGYVSGNLITSAVCGAATVVALLALRHLRQGDAIPFLRGLRNGILIPVSDAHVRGMRDGT